MVAGEPRAVAPAGGAPPEPDSRRFARAGRTARQLWAPVAALAAVAAVIAAVLVVPRLLQSGAGGVAAPVTSSASAPDISALVLPPDRGNGVRVTGVGVLYRPAPDAPIRLCAEVAATLDLPTSTAGCGRVSVATTGADPARLTSTTRNGQSFSGPVRVVGTYHGGTLAIATATDTQFPVEPVTEPPVPCAPPAGGWLPGEGSDDVSALNGLIEYVRARPSTLTDVWQGHPDGAPSAEHSYAPTRSVYVVGTTGDVAAVRAQLRARWAGNLCVHPVRYAADDLNGMVNRLTSITSTPVEASVTIDQSRVRARVVALDEATLRALRAVVPDGALAPPQPLLTPAG